MSLKCRGIGLSKGGQELDQSRLGVMAPLTAVESIYARMLELADRTGSNPVVEKRVGSNPTLGTYLICSRYSQ